jgi:GT2 family glycosyltransferase
VTAVVVARKAGRSLELCLRSALAEPWIDQVIVVDAGNSEGVSSGLRALRADRRDVKLMTVPASASLAAAYNRAAEEAQGRWVLFLDSHVVLQRGGVERLAAAGGPARTPWIVGGRLTDTQGRERRAIRAGALNAFSAVAVAMDGPGALLRLTREMKRQRVQGETSEVSAVSGAFMLSPREDFLALGGFDEGFATDGADLDLCRRAQEAGGSILFQPAASGVQFSAAHRQRRRVVQGLARFAARSARTPLEHAFALIAGPALSVLIGLRDFIVGRPPAPR